MRHHRLLPPIVFAILFVASFLHCDAQSMQERWTRSGLLLSTGKNAEALDLLDGMLKDTALGKGRAEVLFRKGVALSNLHRDEEATLVQREYVTLNPDDAAGWGNLGWSLYLTGKSAAAVIVTEKALQIDATMSFLHFNLGLYKLAEGKTTDAMKHYDTGVTALKEAAEADGVLQDLADLEKKQPALKASIADARAKVTARVQTLQAPPK